MDKKKKVLDIQSMREKGTNRLEFVSRYVVVDVETTGFNTLGGDIIEIAALRVEDGKIVDSFSSLIKPKNQITDFISGLTGITNEMLENAKSSYDVLLDFYQYVEDDIILGHNVNFDINFISDIMFRDIGISFKNDFIDTLRWSRILIKSAREHKLGYLANHLNLSNKPTHRAMSDCLATHELYEYLRRVKCGK